RQQQLDNNGTIAVDRERFAVMMGNASETTYQTLHNMGCSRTLELLARMEQDGGTYYSQVFQIDQHLQRLGPAGVEAREMFRQETLEKFALRVVAAQRNASLQESDSSLSSPDSGEEDASL
ncbi:hypothetical protein BGZ94_004567, partial [Podila epigama]